MNGKEFRQDVVIVINEKEYICIELNRRADAYSLNRNLIYFVHPNALRAFLYITMRILFQDKDIPTL